jgi:uncharacterized OB-fold protein
VLRDEINSVKIKLQGLDTEDLLSVWELNNRNEWREEAFIAIREILETRGVKVPEQKEDSQKKEDFVEEPDNISFLGDEMCLGCGTVVSKLLHTCPECGAPVSRATLDPIGTIMAQGHIYRKASKLGTNKIAIVAMWLLFAPQIVLYLIQAIYIINLWFNSGKSDTSDITTQGILFIFVGMAVVALYCLILYKVTSRFKGALSR